MQNRPVSRMTSLFEAGALTEGTRLFITGMGDSACEAVDPGLCRFRGELMPYGQWAARVLGEEARLFHVACLEDGTTLHRLEADLADG